jgi:uncharacterized protein DUF3455
MHQNNGELTGRWCSGLLSLLLGWASAGCDSLEGPARGQVQDDPYDHVIFAQTAAAAKPNTDPTAGKSAGNPPKPHPMLPCPAKVPEAIDPPAEATLALALSASGTQNYVCAAGKSGEAPSWTLEGPHALLNAGPELAGIHFAGPSWQALDGSVVKGAKLAAADAPKPKAVPWLLLSGAPSGTGLFGNITHIQRLETSGGVAPSSGCDAEHVGAKALVPYKTNYFFYRAAAAGEKVKQCSSGGKKSS